MRGNGCLLPTCWMRQLLRATLALDATLLALLLHLVAVVSAAGEHPSQGDSGGLNTISISAAQSGNEIQLHCSWHAVEVERHNLSFREVGIILDPSYHLITVHRHSNRSLLEAWLTLSSHPHAYFGNYSCCATEVPAASNEADTLVCSNDLLVLPPSGNVSIVTHLLNHGEVLDLSTLNCSEEQWLEVNLQDRSTAVRNTSQNDFIITLTHLQQQAKFMCLNDTSDDVTVEDDAVEQIVYVLADYEPIHYISPAANGTIPPPLPPGHRFEYDCSATARPTPDVYWYDDWYPYYPSEDRRKRIPIPNGERLIVEHLQNQLFDTYPIACVAENVWEKRFRWIKYPDVPPPTTRPSPTSPSPPPIEKPQFNMTITFVPNVCDTRTYSEMIINITGPFRDLLHYVVFENRSSAVIGNELYGLTVDKYVTAYGYVYRTYGKWPAGANGLWEVTLAGDGISRAHRELIPRATTHFIVAENLVEFNHIPPVITANVDKVNSVFNITVSVIVHYHDVDFIEDRIKFSASPSGGAAAIFKSLLQVNRPAVCYGHSHPASVICEHTLILNTSRSDINVNVTGELRWTVEFWTSQPVSSKNVTKLQFVMNPLPQSGSKGNTAVTIVVSVIIVVLIIFSVLIVISVSILVVQRQLRIKRMQAYYDSFTPVQRMLLDVQKEFEESGLLYSLDQLQYEEGKVLGEGAFGVVRKAQLQMSDGASVTVAVKSLKETAVESDMVDFISEFKMLVRVGKHPNIVSLIGAALSIDEEQFFILVEFASGGNLLSYLKQMRKDRQTMSWSKGLGFALQIANGMAHLADKECVHCDLAARNILMTADGTLKVSDFGLARKLYYEVYHKNVTSTTRLPLKWMAIESLDESHEFTTQSDVWSFGVLLWEIATLGGKPYPTIHPKDLLMKLKSLHRMAKPQGCPMNVYTIMRSCWLPLPTQRPTFGQLVAMLDMLLSDYLSASECASITASQAADLCSDHSGSTIDDHQCCQLGEGGMDITGTEYTLGEGFTSAEGWYTGESGSVATMTCQGSHSPINRTSADTPSDHTSTFNGGVCEYCSGTYQDCMCENSAQMTGISIPHGYANLDIERGATQNGNPTSSAPLSYELHSLQAGATLGSSEQPIFTTMVQDGYSSAICDNSDAVTFAPDGRNARDGFVVGLGYGSQLV